MVIVTEAVVWMSFPSDREWSEKRGGTKIAKHKTAVRENKGVCEFPGAAITKRHTLNGSNTEIPSHGAGGQKSKLKLSTGPHSLS